MAKDRPLKILVPSTLGEEERARIRRTAPRAEVRPCGDQAEWRREAADAQVLCLAPYSRELFLAAPLLQWVQVGSAGVERYLWPEFLASDVVLTSASGVFDVPIAEHLLAMMLAHARKLHLFRDYQRAREWHREECGDLNGHVLGILGMGSIGGELARRAALLDLRVHGLRRRMAEAPDYVERLWRPEELQEMLGHCDYIAVTLPLTRTTRGFLGEREFAAMKPNAFVMNIGRGAVIDEAALVRALREGRIAGAGLDVFEQEPLPASSPLWDLPQVILTPHVSGSSPGDNRRTFELFLDNLRRFEAGEPLRNVVDKQEGY